MKRNQKAATRQRGFTIMQMVITVALIAIVTAFGVVGIKNARAEFRLQNAARLFASYVEKARADHDEKASDAEKYRAALARLG